MNVEEEMKMKVVLSCFFEEEDGIRVLVRFRGLGDVYKGQSVFVVRATSVFSVAPGPRCLPSPCRAPPARALPRAPFPGGSPLGFWLPACPARLAFAQAPHLVVYVLSHRHHLT